jgi:hypothetical protein
LQDGLDAIFLAKALVLRDELDRDPGRRRTSSRCKRFATKAFNPRAPC